MQYQYLEVDSQTCLMDEKKSAVQRKAGSCSDTCEALNGSTERRQ